MASPDRRPIIEWRGSQPEPAWAKVVEMDRWCRSAAEKARESEGPLTSGRLHPVEDDTWQTLEPRARGFFRRAPQHLLNASLGSVQNDRPAATSGPAR